MKLLDNLEIIRRDWRVVAKTTVVGVLVSAGISLLLPNMFTAKTMILQSDAEKGPMSMMSQLAGFAAMAGIPMGEKSSVDLFVSLLKSEAIKGPIVDRFKLMTVYKAKYRENAYNKLEKKTVIIPGRKDGIVTIKVTDVDPKLAAQLANGYVEELGKLLSRLSMTDARHNRSYLQERLADAKVAMTQAEDALKAFQRKNKVINVPEQAKASIETIAQLRAQLTAQTIHLAILQRQYTESHQEIRNAKAALAGLQAQISRLESEADNGSVLSVGVAPGLAQEYIRLMREFKGQETLVELLTKQYELSKLGEHREVIPFQVVLTAAVPERKSWPSRSKIVLLSALAVIISVSGVVIYKERYKYLDDSEKETWQRMRALLPSRTKVKENEGTN